MKTFGERLKALGGPLLLVAGAAGLLWVGRLGFREERQKPRPAPSIRAEEAAVGIPSVLAEPMSVTSQPQMGAGRDDDSAVGLDSRPASVSGVAAPANKTGGNLNVGLGYRRVPGLLASGTVLSAEEYDAFGAGVTATQERILTESGARTLAAPEAFPRLQAGRAMQLETGAVLPELSPNASASGSLAAPKSLLSLE